MKFSESIKIIPKLKQIDCNHRNGKVDALVPVDHDEYTMRCTKCGQIIHIMDEYLIRDEVQKSCDSLINIINLMRAVEMGDPETLEDMKYLQLILEDFKTEFDNSLDKFKVDMGNSLGTQSTLNYFNMFEGLNKICRGKEEED